MVMLAFVVLLVLNNCLYGSSEQPKILHLSFHLGCIKDIEEVAKELSLNITSWYILGEDIPLIQFDGVSTGNVVYNISHARAQRIWDRHKDYFNQFDMIITSDTAPLSRIFLQNNWQKPLIVWICNRFDYYDGQTCEGDFPDTEYYSLFRRATKKKNVKIIGYTEYEHYYAAQKGIKTDGCTITPIGVIEEGFRHGDAPCIPTTVNKKDTFFIYPRLNNVQLHYLEQQCVSLGIETYSGFYNGPHDLEGFKGIIYFPYAWSNVAPFENMLRGLIHFIPTESFITRLVQAGAPVTYCTLERFHLLEWYFPEHRNSIVYFDSWQDLKYKIDTINYKDLQDKNKQHALEHRSIMLARWKKIFEELTLLLV